MRAVHVVSGICDLAAGTTHAVDGLCAALGNRGVDVELHTLQPLPNPQSSAYRQIGYPRWRFPAKLGVSPGMSAGLRDAAIKADIVHNHALWMMPNLYAATAARQAGRPQVLSVHGMLAPEALRRSAWKKAIMRGVGQAAALDAVTCFHATAWHEYQDIRLAGFTQPVCVVPFGIDIPATQYVESTHRRSLLFLGRIHPIKGIEVLLRAWQAVEAAFPDWDLIVCGPDNEGYLSAMEGLAGALHLQRVNFVGPRYGAEKQRVLRSCDLLILPSFTENFGMVVAEALAHGKPAIVTRTAPWAGLEQHRCGWWIDTGPTALEACLRNALTLERDALVQMGRRGREWVGRDFSWERIGEMMDLTYQWLLGRAEQPKWVHDD